MEQHKIQEHLVRIGKMVQNGWNSIAKKTGLSIHVGSIYPLSHFDFQDEEPLVLKTLFTQEMLIRGYLAINSFYCSFAHTEDVVQKYLDTTEEVFTVIKKSMDGNTSRKLLKGQVCQSGFKRLN
jgi:glutamate-1-semialdehyde 2,1-aminomutase